MVRDIYSIDAPWPGRLAILPRPRGGDWLVGEIASWKAAQLQVIVSALMPEEMADTELDMEWAEAGQQGLEFVWFPIPDRGTPLSLTESYMKFRRLESLLRRGKQMGIHCRQGIGRSSLIAATLLIQAGVAPQEAWRRIEAARGCPVPDTAEQKAWVEQFTRDVMKPSR